MIATALLLGSPITTRAARAHPKDADTVRLIVRSRAGVSAAKRQYLFASKGARVRDHISQLDATVIEVPRDKLAQVTKSLRRSTSFAGVEEDATARVADIPNDALFASQWGAVQINAVESWSLTHGSPSVVVAVLDTGVDVTHPDLEGQLLPGYDFINNDGDPTDDNGHGTAMTGIIAAKANNGIGLAGIASDSPVLPVKVLDASGFGFYSVIAKGIIYAVDQGARVINLSLAGFAPSATLQSAIDYARAHDVVVVAATGNYGTHDPMYPAACPGVIAVTATNSVDQYARFSNYGAWVSVAAPGVGISSTSLGGGYGSTTGTSPATAVTTAAFALLLAANPAMSAADAVTVMTQNAFDLGTAGWDPYYGFGRVDAYAALVPGQVVRHIVDRTPPVVSLLNPSRDSLVYGVVAVDVAANDNVGVARVDLQVDRQVYATSTAAPFAFAWDTTVLPAGTHKLRAVAYDATGNSRITTETRVDVTPGVGLLVKRGSVGFGRLPGTDSVSITAIFSLPEGTGFDPATDDVTLELTTVLGPVFSMTIPAGSMSPDRSGALRFSGLSVTPASGSVSGKISRNRYGNAYTLLFSSRTLRLANVDPTMNFGVTLGANTLTQSVLLHDSRGRLVLP